MHGDDITSLDMRTNPAQCQQITKLSAWQHNTVCLTWFIWNYVHMNRYDFKISYYFLSYSPRSITDRVLYIVIEILQAIFPCSFCWPKTVSWFELVFNYPIDNVSNDLGNCITLTDTKPLYYLQCILHVCCESRYVATIYTFQDIQSDDSVLVVLASFRM